MKKLLIHVAPLPKDVPLIRIASILYVSFIQCCGINVRECFHLAALTPCTVCCGVWFSYEQPHSDDYGRLQFALRQFPTQTTEEWKWENVYHKLIKICAEYWDIVPKALMDFSGTPRLSKYKLTNPPWPWVPFPVFCTDFHLYNKNYVGYIIGHTCPAPFVYSYIGSVFQHTSWSVFLSVYVV